MDHHAHYFIQPQQPIHHDINYQRAHFKYFLATFPWQIVPTIKLWNSELFTIHAQKVITFFALLFLSILILLLFKSIFGKKTNYTSCSLS